MPERSTSAEPQTILGRWAPSTRTGAADVWLCRPGSRHMSRGKRQWRQQLRDNELRMSVTNIKHEKCEGARNKTQQWQLFLEPFICEWMGSWLILHLTSLDGFILTVNNVIVLATKKLAMFHVRSEIKSPCWMSANKYFSMSKSWQSNCKLI